MDNLLSSEPKKLNGNIRLVELLIKYDANVSRARGEALQTTYQKGDREAFRILLSANPTKEALGWTLKFAVRAFRPDGNDLLPVLLEAAFDQQDLDQALSDAVRGITSDQSEAAEQSNYLTECFEMAQMAPLERG